MKRGINIGDHFENVYDTAKPFANPVQDWYYDTIKALGFDHVRLPVKWSLWTDDQNGYAINETFMNEVEKTVDRFLKLGLEVVLNVHHFREAMDDPKGNAPKLYAIWEQVAKRFCGYPDALIFEVMNEPTWRAPANDWNAVQQAAVQVIRKTNPTRRVMICGVDYSGLFALDDLIPPDDPNLIATFHYYFPLEFTHQGAAWSPSYADIKGVKWMGTQKEREDVYQGIKEHAAAFGQKYHMPVNLGEFGVYGKFADMESRARWTRCVRETCESLGISWSYWEFNRGFGICTANGDKIWPLIDALTKDA